MPRVPSISPTTGQSTPASFIHTIDSNFVDNTGRTLLLRGVNLSGSSKAPVGRPSYIYEGFWDIAEQGGESFVGRPLNLEDGSADVHLARLRGWGFNIIRFPVTWEALEHEGPGKYDYKFMDYIVQVLRKCKEYGFKVYMNPHQDTWSRFSGGSGAPYWTLPACGMNPRNFTATQAAILHCEYPATQNRDPASLPAMIWSTNYGRLASQTLFALFFAGNTFAPNCIIDDVNIEEYLQSHFTEAFGRLADHIKEAGDLYEEVVIGWDSMNEPYEGFIGYEDLNKVPIKQGSTLKKGTFPSPAQSLRLGMGEAQTVDSWTFGSFGPRKNGTVTIDPKGIKMWADPETEPDGKHPVWGWTRSPKWKLGDCIWAQHGVWDVEAGYVLLPEYFRFLPPGPDGTSLEVQFLRDFWEPQFRRYAERIRKAHPEAILFVQPPVFARPPPVNEELLRGRCCYSTHYYDGLTLITRHWNWFNADALGLLRGKYSSTLQAVKIGEGAIRKSLQEQLGILKSDALDLGAGNYPTIIGEIGTPFDMDAKRAYGYTNNGRYKGDFSSQEKALDASMNAADGPNVLNWTLWTYCPDNSHEWGDGWNMEDLSLWSGDDLREAQTSPQMRTGPGSESRAALLRARSATMLGSMTPPAASSLSLQTLPTTNDLLGDAGSTSKISPFHWENAHDFLMDGARAARAFCRPWPTAVVGLPTDIQFNISKAYFKLTVRVRAEDVPVPHTRHDNASTLSGDHVQKDRAPTEIYIPLIHYAHNKSLGDLVEQSDSPESSDVSSGALTPIEDSRNPSSLNLSLPSSHASTLVPGTTLDLEVTVSEGIWDVEGQTLKWWYQPPEPGGADKELTIEVKRGSGPIKLSTEPSSCPSLFGLDSLCPPEICRIM
ncbi:glycoside hydrolase family 5 protein [Serpula lacrymans var. lacrymans S7.3]|uniref:Glycoside hydrolase family 5 protein n=1 Tax=Serpula lacrymans var. lacrymans (strain S7.3) TaxID=936435 RepID=F8Q6V7_SERL3|nr:glycoside hydrolase family 5 protein [Serpula lacrymans var. lacrymans S7.3]